jgi:hypothetical protein
MFERDPAAQAALDQARANADACEARQDHAGRSAAAKAALDIMQATFRPAPVENPTTASQATARLEHLSKNPEFREKLFGKDPATVEEWHRLNKLVADTPDVERALTNSPRTAFETEASVSGAHAGLKDQIDFVNLARAASVPDEHIRIALGPTRGTKEDAAWAQQHLDQLYAQLLRVPLALWPAAARRAAIEFAALISPTEQE